VASSSCRDGACPAAGTEALPRRGKPRLYGKSEWLPEIGVITNGLRR